MIDVDRYIRQEQRLQLMASTIAAFVARKDREYGSSWRKRGGSSAFHVIARKWDRIEQACANTDFGADKRAPGEEAPLYDIFDRFAADSREEGIQDDVIDLIGYLFVLLEHMIEEEKVESICGKNIKDDLYLGLNQKGLGAVFGTDDVIKTSPTSDKRRKR